ETELAAASSIARPEIWRALVPRSSFAKTGAAVIFALVAAALAAAALYIFVPLSSGIKEFAVPYPLPTSVALDGKYLWSCDWQGGAIYQHEIDSNLSLRRIAYFPGQSFSAMTYRSGALYTANPWSKKISRHLINDTFTVEREYSAPGVSVGAMTFALGRLYIADGRRKVISECRLDDASSTLIVLREIPAPSSSVAGLWFDGEKLWSADSAGNFLRRHRLDDTLSVEAEYLLPDSRVKNFRISGFAGKDERFWISSERAGKIISLPVSKLIKVEERQVER
ncbi:MAG: hypothetical protein QME32_00630, partial [Endomicrobiia bacterium]|nr:hypothetical protein [Endomicrobiia bacterium]